MAARNTWSRKKPGSRGGLSQSPRFPLTFLALLIVVLYTVMAAIGTWTPRLAVDLAGGVSAIYTAHPAPHTTTISPGEMSTAVTIFEDRINAFGVSEATVAQEGADTIQVEVPGSTQNAEAQLNLIGKQALLYFRPVLESGAAATATPTSTATGTSTATATPSAGASATATSTGGATVAPATTGAAAKPSTTASGASGQVVFAAPIGGQVKDDAASIESSISAAEKTPGVVSDRKSVV